MVGIPEMMINNFRPFPAGAMLTCELMLLAREIGAGVTPHPEAPPPDLIHDSQVSPSTQAEGGGLAGEGMPHGGGSGPGPGQPRFGLGRLLGALAGLSPGPFYLLLAATSPQGLATAESAQRHGEGAGSSSRPLFFLFFFHV